MINKVTAKLDDFKRWWQELSAEEIEELHRFYAEVNSLNNGFAVQVRRDREPSSSGDREATVVGDTEAF